MQKIVIEVLVQMQEHLHVDAPELFGTDSNPS